MAHHTTGTSSVMPADFLVCGACRRNFTLSSLQDFIQHKLFDCQGVSQKAMECQSCPEKFQTPWSLLQHAQNTHALKIFLEQGPYGAGIKSVDNGIGEPERLGDRGVCLLETPSQGNATQDKHVIPNGVEIHSTRALSQKPQAFSKPAVQLCAQDPTVPVPHISTHRIVTGISNVTTQSTPQVIYNSSSANVVASTQLASTKQPFTHTLSKALVTTSSANPSPVVSVLQPNQSAGEKINNGRPVFITAGVGDKVCSVVRPLSVGSKVHPALRTPGAHSISVLQPIKLPPGSIVSTSLHMNKASQPRMTFAMLPLGLPLSQLKKTSVKIQKATVPASSQHASFELKPDDSSIDSRLLAPGDFTVQASSSAAVTRPALPPSTDGSASNDSALVLEKSPAPPPKIKGTPLPHQISLPDIQVATHLTSDEEATTPSLVEDIIGSVINPSGDMRNRSPSEEYSCQCCKVGKCVRGVEESRQKGSTACPCGLIGPSVNDPPVVPESSIHCCGAAVQTSCSGTKRRKRKNSTTSDHEEEGVDDDSVRCCDNQDCGVTIMPGTHEGLKKCCNAVVPKKRKRHMETKHHIKKQRAVAAAAAAAESSFPEQNTIYIDIQPSSAIPHVSSSVAGGVLLSAADGMQGTITVNTSPAVLTSGTSTGDLNPSSLTLSIPVSYTHQGSCLSGGCTRPSGLNNKDCGCGRCPVPRKFQFTSLRDKKLKSSRRLSASSSDLKKEHLGTQTMKQGDADLSVGVKAESENAAESADEAGERLTGPRKMMRPAMRASVVGKKRRYPTSRPFKCDQCDHAFNQRIHLKKHQSKHTGIKPFKCEQCDYSTVERSHLKVHIRVHTGEKPYKCSHCEYATAQNSTLKIHLKRHHGEGVGDDGSGGSHTPFSCGICGREFDDEAPFIQHQQEHPPGTDRGRGDEVTVTEEVMMGAEWQVGVVEEVEVSIDGGEEEVLANGGVR